MQDFNEEKKVLKYWYCTFHTLNQIIEHEAYKYYILGYLNYIKDSLEKINSDPSKFEKYYYNLNLVVFDNFMHRILKNSCFFKENEYNKSVKVNQ